MARCDLRIELDSRQSSWELGETVQGEVVVDVDGAVKCDDLSVEATWGTHGKGNRARGKGHKLTLFQGRWTGPSSRRYAFELQLPQHGPATYNGHYLNVGWFVRATADIPWKIDPKTEIEIPVAPAPDVEPDWRAQFADENHIPSDLRPKPESDPAVKSSGGSNILGWLIGAGCLAIVVGALAGLGGLLWTSLSEVRDVLSGERSWDSAIGAIAVVAIALLVIAAIATAIAMTVLRKRWLGEVEIAVEPKIVQAGQEIQVVLSGRPNTLLHLNRATLELEGQEVVVRGSGTNKTTYRHKVHENTVEISRSRPLQASMPYRLEGTLYVPETAPPSFGAHSNRLTWRVKAELDVARCPDWSKKQNVVVTPRQRER